MQDGGAWVFAESIEHGGERELASVPRAESSTDDLAGFEVEDNREVMLLATKAEVSEILYPSAGVRHVPHDCNVHSHELRRRALAQGFFAGFTRYAGGHCET